MARGRAEARREFGKALQQALRDWNLMQLRKNRERRERYRARRAYEKQLLEDGHVQG